MSHSNHISQREQLHPSTFSSKTPRSASPPKLLSCTRFIAQHRSRKPLQPYKKLVKNSDRFPTPQKPPSPKSALCRPTLHALSNSSARPPILRTSDRYQ